MDEAMTRDEHPDEGTIHAWLDGQLTPQAADAVAAHVESCAGCAARVAEARGLIAGASRVVGALDDVPASSPAWGSASAAPRARGTRSTWQRLRLTPARAAIAATLLVAAGVTLTYERTGPDTVRETSTFREGAGATTASAPASASQALPSPVASPTPHATPPRDALLDSAIQRNIAKAQPRRVIEAAPPTGVPAAPTLAVAPATVPDTGASARVAAGRIAARAVTESTSARADRTLSPAAAPGAPPVEARIAAAASKILDSAANPADAGGLTQRRARAQVRTATTDPIPIECYRVESANGTPALWGAVEVPFIVALNASGGGARVLTADGEDTGTGARWSRTGADSVLVELRRPGFEGTLALGAPGTVRAGVMRSAPTAPATDRAPSRAPVSAGRAAPTNPSAAVPIIARRALCPER